MAHCLNEPAWAKCLQCDVNKTALNLLIQDDPAKRRKVYLEFGSANPHEVLETLKRAGFDMSSLKRLKEIPAKRSTSIKGLSCLIKGSARAILKFLQNNPKILLVSIDLPEYSWLSCNSGPLSF